YTYANHLSPAHVGLTFASTAPLGFVAGVFTWTHDAAPVPALPWPAAAALVLGLLLCTSQQLARRPTRAVGRSHRAESDEPAPTRRTNPCAEKRCDRPMAEAPYQPPHSGGSSRECDLLWSRLLFAETRSLECAYTATYT